VGLKEELQTEVAAIFRAAWTERDGTTVPTDDSVKLANDAVNLEATVLYADMADSTQLVDGQTRTFAAEIYKTYLLCAAKIIRSEGGTIVAYDGDRVMAIYIGDPKNTPAVRTALKINFAIQDIITPALKNQYKTKNYVPRGVVGIDTSKLLIAKTGIRGANDLVWVGRAANYAAKLTTLPSTHPTYITAEVFNGMHDSIKTWNGQSMWEAVSWNSFDNRTIYRSHWKWTIE
jgi:class 3 adenylate cyclase